MMDESSQKVFDTIIAKDISALKEGDLIFLRARRDYLTPIQTEIYSPLLFKTKPLKEDGKHGKTFKAHKRGA
jgi:hypothetical protein